MIRADGLQLAAWVAQRSYDDCADGMQCPTSEQFEVVVTIAVIVIALVVLGKILLGVVVATDAAITAVTAKAKITPGNFHARVRADDGSTAAMCGARLYGRSISDWDPTTRGRDWTMEVWHVTCEDCLKALEERGWDGHVHMERLKWYFGSFGKGTPKPWGADANFCNAVYFDFGLTTASPLHKRERINCEECLEALPRHLEEFKVK